MRLSADVKSFLDERAISQDQLLNLFLARDHAAACELAPSIVVPEHRVSIPVVGRSALLREACALCLRCRVTLLRLPEFSISNKRPKSGDRDSTRACTRFWST